MIFKPVYSATETCYKIEILTVESFDMILSKIKITKALVRLRGCAGWSAPVLFANPEERFSLAEAQLCHVITKLLLEALAIGEVRSNIHVVSTIPLSRYSA